MTSVQQESHSQNRQRTYPVLTVRRLVKVVTVDVVRGADTQRHPVAMDVPEPGLVTLGKDGGVLRQYRW